MNRVLVVEKEESLRQLLLGFLSTAPNHLTPILAASGEEALRLLEQETFDTLLVNPALAGFDGIELLIKAKVLRPNVRTVAMSASSSPELQARILDSGAIELLRKPLDFEELMETLAYDTAKPGQLAYVSGDFNIADLCLLGVLSGRDGGFQVGGNGSTALLVLAGGALVHASIGELQGRAAFKKILRWERLELDHISAAAAGRLSQNIRLDEAWLLEITKQLPHLGGKGFPPACRVDGMLFGAQLEDLLKLLERKQETGTLTVVSGERCGVLVLLAGQILRVDTDAYHGQEAIDEILSWQNLKATYNRIAATPAAVGAEAPAERSPAGGDDPMASLRALIDELRNEVADFIAADVVRLSNGRSVAGFSSDPELDPAVVSSSCADILKSHLQAAELLGGTRTLGNTEDILITMGKVSFLVRMLGTEHFLCLVLATTSNPALGRFVMRKYEPLFLGALRDHPG